MANARAIQKRRKAVQNTRKITNVMGMIAASRYQRAYRRAMGTKPYVRKLNGMIAAVRQSLQASGTQISHPLIAAPSAQAKQTAVLVLTSTRGLCGGYNGNILRLAMNTVRELEAAGQQVDLHVAGRKGVAYMRFINRTLAGSYLALGDQPRYVEIDPIAQQFIDAYSRGEIAGVKVIYMRFISAARQVPYVLDLLPLGQEATGDDAQTATTAGLDADFDFSPAPAELLNELLPKAVKVTLFQCFIESVVSEQLARRVAMKAATDNADVIVKQLTQLYNRVRQASITSQLSELMGGVEAMK